MHRRTRSVFRPYSFNSLSKKERYRCRATRRSSVDTLSPLSHCFSNLTARWRNLLRVAASPQLRACLRFRPSGAVRPRNQSVSCSTATGTLPSRFRKQGHRLGNSSRSIQSFRLLDFHELGSVGLLWRNSVASHFGCRKSLIYSFGSAITPSPYFAPVDEFLKTESDSESLPV